MSNLNGAERFPFVLASQPSVIDAHNATWSAALPILCSICVQIPDWRVAPVAAFVNHLISEHTKLPKLALKISGLR